MDKPSNPQAYPCLDSNGHGLAMHDPGMTLRDWFAGQAIAGLMFRADGPAQREEVAAMAGAIADAMLAERERIT